MEILRGKVAVHLDTARVMRPPKSFRSCGARGVPNVRALTGASSYADEDALAFYADEDALAFRKRR